MSAEDQTNRPAREFDFSAFPDDTCFFERRDGLDRRHPPAPPAPRPAPDPRRKADRRRRVDPTTFEKQYQPDEIEFMNAMQRYKVQTGKAFPSYGEVLAVAVSLGYRRLDSDHDLPTSPALLPVSDL